MSKISFDQFELLLEKFEERAEVMYDDAFNLSLKITTDDGTTHEYEVI